jgi:hypothetical protein
LHEPTILVTTTIVKRNVGGGLLCVKVCPFQMQNL